MGPYGFQVQPLDADGHRPLQELDIHDHSHAAIGVSQNALDVLQCARPYAEPLANGEVRPWHRFLTGTGDAPESRHLMRLHRNRPRPCPYHLHNTGRFENWQEAGLIQMTEYVAREKRKVDFLDPVRPLAARLVQRQETLDAAAVQRLGRCPLKVRANSYRKPVSGGLF